MASYYDRIQHIEFEFEARGQTLFAGGMITETQPGCRRPFFQIQNRVNHKTLDLAMAHYANILYSKQILASDEAKDAAAAWFGKQISAGYPEPHRRVARQVEYDIHCSSDSGSEDETEAANKVVRSGDGVRGYETDGESVEEYFRRVVTDSDHDISPRWIFPSWCRTMPEATCDGYIYMLKAIARNDFACSQRKINEIPYTAPEFNRVLFKYNGSTYEEMWRHVEDIKRALQEEQEQEQEEDEGEGKQKMITFMPMLSIRNHHKEYDVGRLYCMNPPSDAAQYVLEFTHYLQPQDIWAAIGKTYKIPFGSGGPAARSLWHRVLLWQLLYGFPPTERSTESEEFKTWMLPTDTTVLPPAAQLADFNEAVGRYFPTVPQVEQVENRIRAIRAILDEASVETEKEEADLPWISCFFRNLAKSG